MTVVAQPSLLLTSFLRMRPNIRRADVFPRLRPRFFIYMLAIALPLACWNGTFALDDAYIVLHNARALLGGGNGLYQSPALTGSTSPVHLALVAALGLVLALPIASLLVGLGAAVIYALGLDLLVTKMGAKGWHVPALVLTGLAGGVMPIQLFNGLETGLAAATVTWLLLLQDDRRLPVLAGLAPFVRPELAILSILLLARACWLQGSASIPRTGVIAASAAFPFATWLLVSTGHLLPQTAHAKALFFAQTDWSVAHRASVLAGAIIESGLLLLLVGGFTIRRGGWVRTSFVLAVLVVATTTIPGAVVWNDYRYLTPLVPALLANLASRSSMMGRVLTVGASAVSLSFLPSSITTLRDEHEYWRDEMQLLSATIKHIPAHSVVLIHDAGIVAWLAPKLHLVDVVGLKSPRSIEWHRKFTHRTCDYGDALDGIARESNATYALALKDEPCSCIPASLQAKGWHVSRIAGPSHYRLFKLARPSQAR